MLEAYEYSRWDHTASLLACVTGLVRKGIEIKDFHPYRRREGVVRATGESLQSLRGVLPKWQEPHG